VNYRPWLEGDALRQMGGLPHDAFDILGLRLRLTWLLSRSFRR
jgi:hypothetical protein